jgi:hypothetical protein
MLPLLIAGMSFPPRGEPSDLSLLDTRLRGYDERSPLCFLIQRPGLLIPGHGTLICILTPSA